MSFSSRLFSRKKGGWRVRLGATSISCMHEPSGEVRRSAVPAEDGFRSRLKVACSMLGEEATGGVGVQLLLDSRWMHGIWVPTSSSGEGRALQELDASHKVSQLYGGAPADWVSRTCWQGTAGALVYVLGKSVVEEVRQVGHERSVRFAGLEATAWYATQAWKSRKEPAWLVVEGDAAATALAVTEQNAEGFCPALKPAQGDDGHVQALAGALAGACVAVGVKAEGRVVWLWSEEEGCWNKAETLSRGGVGRAE